MTSENNNDHLHCPATGKLVVEIGQDGDCFTILTMDRQAPTLATLNTQEMAEALCKGMGWNYSINKD